MCSCHHYHIKKLTIKDSLVDNVAIVLPENRATVDIAAVGYIANHFQAAVLEKSLNGLEVLDYKLAPLSCMPTTFILARSWTNVRTRWYFALPSP